MENLDLNEIIGFSEKNVNNFNLNCFEKGHKEKLLDQCLSQLRPPCASSASILAKVLKCVRILTRDKDLIPFLTQQAWLKVLLHHSGIAAYAEQPAGPCVTIVACDTAVVVEAISCLFNIVFNCHSAAKSVVDLECMKGIVNRTRTYGDPELDYEVKFNDMRLLFYVTAVIAENRLYLFRDLCGIQVLNDACRTVISSALNGSSILEDKKSKVVVELLKVLFNIGHAWKADPSGTISDDDLRDFSAIVSTSRDLLFIKCTSNEKTNELLTHTVNFLTTVPYQCYENLLFTDSLPENTDTLNLFKNEEVMKGIGVLLDYLDSQLLQDRVTMTEAVKPILQVLICASKYNRNIRKYGRYKVLPYLGNEVVQLPEVGSTLRNKLCRNLTNIVEDITEMSAYFIFILLKESVNRAIKYTGYGNFAGFLCRHGLMRGSDGDGDVEFSSSSDDSDTEEFEELRDKVNPVTGRAEEPRPDPMEGYSEERKEFEVMRLVEAIDKLQRSGIIQPGVIGEDGKVRPAEHVLELANSVAEQQDVIRKASARDLDSDSD